MRLQFLGAAGTVTGSKYLLEVHNQKILVDCGLFQGLKSLRLQNWEPFPFSAAQIKAVVLTHAHIDHSGYLPRLFQEGFRGVVYCTEATADLCKILLLDSAKLMDEEARYANRKGFSKHKPALPLFTPEDVHGVLQLFQPKSFHTDIQIGNGVKALFKRAGHILGAASVRIDDGATKITFSGDVGRLIDPVMVPPDVLGETDYLVVESTYGNRRHSEIDPLEQLSEIIHEAIREKGSVLVPAFAVGRAQEVLYYLMKLIDSGRIPDIPIVLDSPMATQVTAVFCDHFSDHRLSQEECDRMLRRVLFIHELEESIQNQSRTDSRIIISASGMATGGRVLHYLKKMARQSENVILFAGFQAAGTRGASMVGGAEEIKIHGEYIPVRAKVRSLQSLSAHADAEEIVSWLRDSSACKPKRVFITHGEPAASDALRLRLTDQFGWKCDVPAQGDAFEL